MKLSNIYLEKRRFISYELGLLTMKAALATRNVDWPIYKKNLSSSDRKKAKDAIRKILKEIEVKYTEMLKPKEHINYISEVSNKLTQEIGIYLHKGRFRIGIAQKLINLHLKYLWCSGLIDEPPHCPIDGIIRDKAELDYDWIKSDNINEYINTISQLQEKTNNSIALWELHKFRRRDENY